MQSRSLHPTDAEHKGFGHSPTSILQRKKCFCIDENIACGCYEASQGAFQIWKLFCDQDRPFSSFTWCGRLFFFLLRKFSSLQSQQAGRVGTNSQFLNQIFQIRLQKYLLGFSQTRYSAQNCAECASYPLKALWPTRGLVPSSSLFFRQSFPCFFLQATESNVFSKLFVDTARFLW